MHIFSFLPNTFSIPKPVGDLCVAGNTGAFFVYLNLWYSFDFTEESLTLDRNYTHQRSVELMRITVHQRMGKMENLLQSTPSMGRERKYIFHILQGVGRKWEMF